MDDIKRMSKIPAKDRQELSVAEFGLNPEIKVYYPFKENDDLTNEIILAIADKDYVDGEYYCIEDCMELFLDVRNRQLVEGYLMQGTMPADIAADLGYKQALIETYACAFFDTSVWRTDADRFMYIQRGTIGDDSRMKHLINTKGMEYVQVHEYNMPAKVKMDKALANLFGRMYEKTMQLMASPDKDEQLLAQTWAKRSLEAFSELKNAAKSEGGIRELTIALKTSDAPSKGLGDLV